MWADLDKLRIERPALHRLVAQQTGFMTGIRVVDVRDYSAEVGRGIQEWERGNERQSESEFNNRLAEFKKHQATPDIAAQATPVVQSARDYEQPAEPRVTIDFEQTLREEAADLQKRADEAAAKNRLTEHAAAGLEESDANFNLIKAFVDKSVKGYWSSAVVDVAVANLGPRGSNQLTWRKAEAPPSPAPETVEPQEVLITLKDGSQQLPLDATPSKHHTSEQLKDWLKRTNEGKLIRPRGSFSSHLA